MVKNGQNSVYVFVERPLVIKQAVKKGFNLTQKRYTFSGPYCVRIHMANAIFSIRVASKFTTVCVCHFYINLPYFESDFPVFEEFRLGCHVFGKSGYWE